MFRAVRRDLLPSRYKSAPEWSRPFEEGSPAERAAELHGVHRQDDERPEDVGGDEVHGRVERDAPPEARVARRDDDRPPGREGPAEEEELDELERPGRYLDDGAAAGAA